MAVVHPDERVVTVYGNEAGEIVISQATKDDPYSFVVVEPRDVSELCHALEAVAQQIEEASKCQPG